MCHSGLFLHLLTAPQNESQVLRDLSMALAYTRNWREYAEVIYCYYYCYYYFYYYYYHVHKLTFLQLIKIKRHTHIPTYIHS